MRIACRDVDRWCARAGRAAALALLLGMVAPAVGQTCSYNPGQPNVTGFGTINPTLTATATFSITVNYKCTGGANASFTITGANDTGPGAYRLRHVTQSSQYMAYSIAATNESRHQAHAQRTTRGGELPERVGGQLHRHAERAGAAMSILRETRHARPLARRSALRGPGTIGAWALFLAIACALVPLSATPASTRSARCASTSTATREAAR